MTEIKCAKCMITLEKMKKDGISDYMIKCIGSDGGIFICRSCIEGWTD